MNFSGSLGISSLAANLDRIATAIRTETPKALLRAGHVIAADAQKRVSGPRPSNLGVVTGRLRSSLHAESRGWGRVVVGTNVEYAAIHEYGGMIFAKKPLPGSKTGRPWLRFPITKSRGKGRGRKVLRWVTVDRVRIPRRPYFEPAIKAKTEDAIKIVREVYAGPLHIGGKTFGGL